MDSLFYNYISNTDKLSSLNDYASTTGLGYHDLQNGGSGYLMTYDPMGNLLTDNGNSDGYSLNYSHYNMHEKPDTTRGNTPLKDTDPARSMANTTSYYYDAFGNQVATKTISVFENNEGHEETDITTNYTVVDALGIPLASYMFKYGPATTGPGGTEYHFGFDYKRYVYGGAGQGCAAILLPDEELQSSENMFYPYYNIKLYDKMAVYPGSLPIAKLYHRDYKRGRKIYEIKDFQGTPRLMFSDKRFVSGGVDQLDLKSVQNYYPYGMEIPFRNWAADAIRYGFQGMDKDTSYAPNNEFYTTMFRSYDPRKARWMQRDPIHHPWEGAYTAFGNNPVMFTDPLGADDAPAISTDRAPDRSVQKAGGSDAMLPAFGIAGGGTIGAGTQAATQTGENALLKTLAGALSGALKFGGAVVTTFFAATQPLGENDVMHPFQVNTNALNTAVAEDEEVSTYSNQTFVQDNTQPKPKPKPFPTQDPIYLPILRDQDEDQFIYRGGSESDANFTPRPGTDTNPLNPKRGLSAFTTPEEAYGDGSTKAQKLSVKKLQSLGFQITKFGTHRSILPPIGPQQQQQLEEWANTRPALLTKPPTGLPHTYVGLIRMARRGTVYKNGAIPGK